MGECFGCLYFPFEKPFNAFPNVFLVHLMNFQYLYWIRILGFSVCEMQ